MESLFYFCPVKRHIFFFLMLSLFAFPAQAYYDFDEKLHLAYTQILKLKLDEGKELLRQEHLEKPGNHLTLLYENYIDFLKGFISEEESDFIILKKNCAQRLKIISKDKDDTSSPFHLYVNAEMILQEAMLKIKFKEHVSAATDIRKAYRMVEKNELIFPTFILNKKLIGFLHVMVGAVPKEYHWLVEMAGMEGTVPQGTSELMDLFEHLEGTPYTCYRDELLFYLGNIHNSFAKNESHGELLLERMLPSTVDNPLIRYCYANVAMKMGRNEDALRVLTVPMNPDGVYAFHFLSYKTGLARLRKLDYSGEEDFRKFIAQFKGKNYLKAAWQKVAWISFLKGDQKMYHEYMLKARESGLQFVDEDKEAMTEASGTDAPNALLLRSRLLFDGGYYKESMHEIAGMPLDSFPRYRDQLEVTYRFGRILQKMKQVDKAMEYYEQTLKNGSTSRYYFAANSALLLGMIYEERKDFPKAKSYFEKCLSLDNHEYQNSLDQKAQAGLDRIRSAE